jgi:hypothetical protein
VSRLAFTLHAAGVLAPGLASLADLRAAARSSQPLPAAQRLSLPSPDSLPATERRRASQVVRLTLGCIEQALQSSPFAAEDLRSVFATDEGSGEICQQMLELLATSRPISPLLFSNSVLNAPSGYFSIARRNRQPSTVVSVGLESFAAGLVCAVTDAAATRQAVLLVAYDAAMTPPMTELLATTEPTAAAWIVSSMQAGAPALASFELRFDPADEGPPSPLPDWMPERWAGQSSAVALAALGLLDAGENAVYRLPLGGRLLSLRCTEAGRA